MRSAVIAVGALLLSVGTAEAQSCYDLWYQRNAIFKSAGYCFRTRQAIAEFGNASCQYDDERDVPLSARNRQRVESLRAQERRYGCR
jgi:hypothetical protein